ncbi:unnamed protein product [Leuciscus chuanchicus]
MRETVLLKAYGDVLACDGGHSHHFKHIDQEGNMQASNRNGVLATPRGQSGALQLLHAGCLSAVNRLTPLWTR